ncbi:MAG: hypothetical protein ACPGWR_26770, partial [Ardenticatenaceae bacterium]
QSAIRNPQSEIRNPQSAIRNPKSEILLAVGVRFLLNNNQGWREWQVGGNRSSKNKKKATYY